MAFILSFIQMLGWVATGYSLAKGNNWAVAVFVLANIALGLMQAMNMVGIELRKSASTNQSK